MKCLLFEFGFVSCLGQVRASAPAAAAAPVTPVAPSPKAGAKSASAKAAAAPKAGAKSASAPQAMPGRAAAGGAGSGPSPAGSSAAASPGSAEKGGHQTQNAAFARAAKAGSSGLARAETRGRKAKDLHLILVKLTQDFLEAPPTSPLFWGSEAKTAMKLFEQLNKDVQARANNIVDDDTETAKMRCILKHTTAIHNVLQVVNTNGLDTQEFAAEFDMQQTSCNLEPVVEVFWPQHVLWSRHRMRIGAMAMPDPWFQMVSTPALKENGVSEVELAVEQDKLLGERVMSLLKRSTYQDRGGRRLRQ